MERVALDLQTTAISVKQDTEGFDLFGRSAFNRYYYATFLITRTMLRHFDPSWSGTHSSIPEQLKGSILRRIKDIEKKSIKISDKEAISICGMSKSSISDLSKLLTDAYSVRVAADYHPEVLVVVSDSERFKLQNVSINAAHQWPARARIYTSSITRAWDLAL